MAIVFGEREYKNFGRVLAIENGHAEILVTLECGPRIIKYSLPGGENFMYEDNDNEIIESGPEFDSYFYPDAYWRTYGGHRIWLTPEAKPETYYPDNDEVNYTVSNNIFTFTPPPQKSNNVQHTLELVVSETSSDVRVTAYAKNTHTLPQVFGIWQVSVMCAGGTAIVPQNKKDTGLLHNRTMSLWPYCNMADPRVTWGKELISLRQDPKVDLPFKFGISCERGFSAYLCHGALFVKRFPYYAGLNAPDDGCNFEIYTNRHFLELESLGKLAAVAPDETILSSEEWSLIPGVTPVAADDMTALEGLTAKLIEK